MSYFHKNTWMRTVVTSAVKTIAEQVHIASTTEHENWLFQKYLELCADSPVSNQESCTTPDNSCFFFLHKSAANNENGSAGN